MTLDELKTHWITRLRTEAGLTEWWKQHKIVEELVEELYKAQRGIYEKPI